MDNNEILCRLSTIFALSDERLAELFALGGEELTAADALARTLGVDCIGAQDCSAVQLGRFLDGLIIDNRGPSERSGPPRREPTLTNNAILKKLRIAMILKEADMLAIFDRGGLPMTRQSLSPLFRKPDNKHYRSCTDRMLKCFLIGLEA